MNNKTDWPITRTHLYRQLGALHNCDGYFIAMPAPRDSGTEGQGMLEGAAYLVGKLKYYAVVTTDVYLVG